MLDAARTRKRFTVSKTASARRSTLSGDYVTLERPEGVLLLADIKRTQKPLLKNGFGQRVGHRRRRACFEFTSKMNALDADIVMLLNQTIQLVQAKYKALVIYNEGTNFSRRRQSRPRAVRRQCRGLERDRATGRGRASPHTRR